MAIAGYTATVKATGAATAMTGEAVTLVTGTTYQITNTARRIMDPDTAVVVYDDATPLTVGTDYTVNYLFGIITLTGAPSGTVTVDGGYLAAYDVGELRGVSVTCTRDLADVSVHGTQAKAHLPTLKDCSGSFNTLRYFFEDIDTDTGGTQSIQAWFAAGTPKLLEVDFGSGTQRYLRAWVMFEGLDLSAAVDGVVEGTANFQGAHQAGSEVWALGT